MDPRMRGNARHRQRKYIGILPVRFNRIWGQTAKLASWGVGGREPLPALHGKPGELG